MDAAKTGVSIDLAETIDNDKPRGGAEKKVNIIAKKKWIDANSEIYYIPQQEQNPNNSRQDQ